MKLTINVLVGRWRASDFEIELEGGRYELPNDDVALSKPLVEQIRDAEIAGVLEILDADAAAAKIIAKAESDEESLAKLEAAVKTGAWLEGHLENVIAESGQHLELLADELQDESLSEEDAAALLERAGLFARLHDDAKARLASQRREA